MQPNKPRASAFLGLVAILTLARPGSLIAQVPVQRDQSAWVSALLDRFPVSGYRLQLGTTRAGSVLGLMLEDSVLLQAPDSVQRSKAREIATYVLRTAKVEPAVAAVVVGWKSPVFAGAAREVSFRYAADSLRSIRDSS
jgi:hypothetical protein